MTHYNQKLAKDHSRIPVRTFNRQDFCRLGIAEYAWWKDGVQYVGASGTTLVEAMKEAHNKKYGLPLTTQGVIKGEGR